MRPLAGGVWNFRVRALPKPWGPISGHHVPISIYSDIEPDIGYDIADTGTRYRDIIMACPSHGPDIGIPDIGPGTRTPDIGTYPISGHTRYRDTRYRDTRYHDRVCPYIGTNIGIMMYPPGRADIGTKCHDIGSLSFPISHTMSLVPSRPQAQGYQWG